jgi:hypothetical protein
MAESPTNPKSLARPRIPVQLLLLSAFTIAMMLLTLLKLENPQYGEASKARLTAQYYLEDLGHAQLDKLGADLHPQPRSHFDPPHLNAYFAALGLDKPVSVLSLSEEHYDKAHEQWMWIAQLKAGTGTFPLVVAVRKPQEQSITRRWRIYALCRLDQDLITRTHAMFQSKAGPALFQSPAKIPADFSLAPESTWQMRWTLPANMIVPSEGKSHGLLMVWEPEPDGSLGCSYQLKQLTESKQ